MIELTTQCPQCDDRFDVSLPQLQQRKGLIRCARCAHIFDAYECAVEANHPPGRQSVSTPLKAPEFSTYFLPHFRYHFIGEQPLSHGAVLPPVIQTRRGPVAVQAFNSSSISSSQPLQRTDAEPALTDIRVYLHQDDSLKKGHTTEPVFSASSADTDTEPFFYDSSQRSASSEALYGSKAQGSSWSRFLWRFLFLVLAVILLSQLLYVYRAQLANTVSFSRPLLQLMCNALTCDVPYMREISAIEITQSSLQQQTSSNTAKGYEYQLQLQLHNKLNWPQEWPTLVVSFSDAAAATMATIAIPPEQYLSSNLLTQPFAAGISHKIRLPVWLKNKKINGFSVDKYYP